MAFDEPEGNLGPLPEDLTPEARALAEFLRVHFNRLHRRLREYARETPWHFTTISRYLSGRTIPPPEFIDALLAVAGPQRSREEVEAEREQARELHLNALRVRNAHLAEVARITYELRDANEEVQLSHIRERLLNDDLEAARRKYAALYLDYAALLDRDQRAQAVNPERLDQLSDERDRALEKVQRLERELEAERLAREEAENKRDALLTELQDANAALARSGGSALGIFAYGPLGLTVTVLRGNEARWQKLLALVATYALTRGAPLYLGFVYHFASREEPLRVFALCGLLIPVWFAVSVRRAARPERKGNARYCIWAVAVTAVLFVIAAWL
jgi:hypothetical protein